MADRRQPFLRFWGRQRRTPAAETQPPPPAAQTPPPPPPAAQTQPPPPPVQAPLPPPPAAQTPPPPPPDAANSGQPPITTSPTTPTNETQTPPPPETQTPPPPTTTPSPNSTTPFPPAKTTDNSSPTPQPVRSQAQTDHPLTNTLNEPKTPSQTTETKSRSSSSKPPSPTPRTPQSRTPPHPLSQSRSTTSTSLSGNNSKPPFTPQRASQPRSPSSSPRQTTSNSSPKQRNLGSPSTKSRQTSQEKVPKPVRSQQEPQTKAKVESPSADNEAKETTTESSDSSTINGELKAKPEDIKDVKEVVAQETKEKVSPSLNPKLGFEEPIIGNSKTAMDDRNVSIITLAGENRGASMQMGSTPKEGTIHIHRGYKVNPDEGAETTTDGEGSSRSKQSEDGKVTEDKKEACVNNNAQGINNSIVFNSSIAEGSPGVHMVVTHVPKEPVSPAEGIGSVEARRAEFNMSRAEKLVYEPTVRRRCLRGLLLETSDSDLENPEKPRRHGCRVGCEIKNKEKGIDVV